MKNSSLSFILLFLTTVLIGQNSSIYLNKKFLKGEIEVQPYKYATVNQDNAIAIWEKELGLTRSISHLFKIDREVDLYLDYYANTIEPGIGPAIILIHGGAFMPNVGSYRDPSITMLAYEFAQRGYKVFSIEYRTMNLLAPSFLKGAYIAQQDARAAIRFIANHHLEFKIDPGQIFIGGVSAGAITALNVAFMGIDDPIAGRSIKFDQMYGCLECVGEAKKQTHTIAGVINIAGGVYDLDMLDENIPLISIHGDDDTVIPINCGLPFTRFSQQYNSFIGQVEGLLSNTSAKHKIRQAKILDMCGSEAIDAHRRSKGLQSILSTSTGFDHYVLMSHNQVYNSSGMQAVQTISNFLYRESN